jgi:predicted kinase
MQEAKLTGKERKLLSREFLRNSSATISDHPTLIVLAGLPGAGKTEFSKNLITELLETPLRLDMDEIAEGIEGYSPQKAHAFRLDATAVLEKIYDEAIKKKYMIIMDGTFGHGKAIQNLRRAIDRGYIINVIYIYQIPAVAWGFTKDRELVEKRAIDKEGFIETYYAIFNNLEELQKLQNVKLSVIIKDEKNRVGNRVDNVENLFDLIPPKLDISQLKSDIME